MKLMMRFNSESPFYLPNTAPSVYHLARSQPCEMIFIWSAPNRYAIRTSIAELAPFVAYLCNTSPYPNPL
jgi:hypothetical protein